MFHNLELDDVPDLSQTNLKNRYVKTYPIRKKQKMNEVDDTPTDPVPTPVPPEALSTKNAVKFLLEGKLKTKVCRYCLNVTSELAELDQIMHVGGERAIYKVTIRDMVASFHPFKVADDPNFPNKICDKCVDRTISAYLFAQQCERAERALRNCLEDIHEKFEKLDPLERPRKRGRQKKHPNHNVLYTEHQNVIDYAEPIINIINISSESLTEEQALSELECKKCCQLLPNVESLVNHEKRHPKSMWYNCRLCGRSFVKLHHLKRHQRTHLVSEPKEEKPFSCTECWMKFDVYNEYLQHKENHQFKMVMEHLIERKMNVLCSICLEKGTSLTDLDDSMCIHGPYPELSGDINLYTVLGSTLPEINSLYNTGRKICRNCLNHAITAYVFTHRARFIRKRLDTCITLMLEHLNDVQPVNKIFVEINQQLVCPKLNDMFDNNLLLEDEYPIDVLEDEFRVKSESEDGEASDENMKDDQPSTIEALAKGTDAVIKAADVSRESDVTADFLMNEGINGYSDLISDICSEFLTFNKKKKPKIVLTKCKFTCPLCNKHFISIYFLKLHVLKHINKIVKCTVCDSVFKSKFHLYEHTKMVHLLKTSHISCGTCGRCFTSQDKLKTHELHHKTKLCPLCDKMFQSQEYFDNHMQRHGLILRSLIRNRKISCSFCEKNCQNDNELSLHVNKVHLQIKPYACDMCERNFYTESNLRNHIKMHSIRSRETCEFCGKTLKSRRQLVIHVRKHIGVKPFSCQICGQAFYSQHKTMAHMKLFHEGQYDGSV